MISTSSILTVNLFFNSFIKLSTNTSGTEAPDNIPIIFEFALRNKSVFDKTYIYVLVSVFIPLLLILAYQYFGQGKAFDPTSLSNYLILFLAISFLSKIFKYFEIK